MANRYPLIVNSQSNSLEELPVGDNLNLGGCNIIGVTSIFSEKYYGYLAGICSVSEYLSDASNILTGTISTQRLSGFYNIGVQTSIFLENAENIKSGTISTSRLNGTYDISISGTSETSNYLENAANINDGTLSSDRLSGVYNINITGTSNQASGLSGIPDIQVGIVSCSTISDDNGYLRTIPQIISPIDYTLGKSDVGCHISIASTQLYVPPDVFDPGDVVYIYNDSSSDLTMIEVVDVTLRTSGTLSTGNVTLSSYSLTTILCVKPNEFVVR